MAAALAVASRPAAAQEAAEGATHQAADGTPVPGAKLSITLPGGTLAEALEAIYKAAGSPAHTVDAAAREVTLDALTLSNVEWHEAARWLAARSGFTLRHVAGACLIAPRLALSAAAAAYLPMLGDRSATLSAQTQARPQTAPGLGTGGSSTGTENKEYRVLRVQHVYVGGIARLFADAATISTEEFLLPDGAFRGGGLGGGGGGFGGQGGGRGGFGGGQGGFGGGGFGGGGLGGFGGGGFGGGVGGFGGGGGGFGGGGFGGGGRRF